MPNRIRGNLWGSMMSLVGLAVCAGLPGSALVGSARADEPKISHEYDPQITAADLASDVKVLASNAFEGRAPDTRGEQLTVDFLSSMLRQTGLQPGNGDSYFQTVTAETSILDTRHSRIRFKLPHGTRRLEYGRDVVYASNTSQTQVTIDDKPVVFVGYGIDAPEANWNDYAGVDVRGKVVLALVGLPGMHDGKSSVLNTYDGASYYGRAGYKSEQAAREGAVATLVVHDEHDFGYSWDYIRKVASLAHFYLRRQDDADPSTSVSGWISRDAAKAVFEAAGTSLQHMRDVANQRGFTAMPLQGVALDAKLKNVVLKGKSRNVIAKLPGSKYPDEAIVYSAHWDHFGRHPKERGDNIYHGALDNGIGVAAVLEVAAQFAADDPKPDRTIIFLIPTMEELGLLGSQYYTRHPVIPMANTVVEINFDVLIPEGYTPNFAVSGLGRTDLAKWLKPIVERQHRALVGVPPEESDSFFRSDHLNFAKAGVPVLYVRGGNKNTSTAIDAAWRAFGDRYHKPADRYNPHWDMRGVAQDVQIAYEMGKMLASEHVWPSYQPGSEFRAIRDASRRKAGADKPASSSSAASGRHSGQSGP